MADLGLSRSSENQTLLVSSAESVSCSICLELVTDTGERSIAKLKCGHHFHLDCIGSAFNAKGSMECPNCRRVEMGRWLYGSGRPFEDHSINGIFNFNEDDFEVYAGIADLIHPHEELLSDSHWSVYPSFPHQHIPVNLAEASASTRYTELLLNLLYGDHGGASSFHRCPYLSSQSVQLPSQSQFLSANVGIPHSHEMASPMPSGVNIRGHSARTQRAPVSSGSPWNARSAGPSVYSNSPVNVNYVEAPVLPRERTRDVPVSGNHVYGVETQTFGQFRFYQGFPIQDASLSEVPNVTLNVFPRPENLGSSMHNGTFPALHHGLPGARRSSRGTGFSLAPLSGQSSEVLRQRTRNATWNSAGGDYGSGMHAVGWNGSAFTLGPSWHPYGSISPSYGGAASSVFHDNEFYGADGPL